MTDSLLEASSPNTAPSRLRELSRGLPEEPANARPLVEALLQNPNSPLEVLISLSKEAPLALNKNVSLPLLLIEDPNFLAAFPFTAICALVAEASTPLWLVEACYRGHTKANDSVPTLYIALAKRPTLSPFLIEQLSLCQHRVALLALLRHPGLPASCLERLLCSPIQAVRRGAAKHPLAPLPLIQAIRRAGASLWLDTYAKPDLSMTAEELQALLSRGSFAARVAVRHPRFPVETLQTLLAQRDDLVSSALKNPRAPGALLARYQKTYRHLIAKHPNTPEETLLSLLILGEGYALPALQRAALENFATPPRFVALWRRTEEKDPNLTASELQEFASYGGFPRQLALSHPKASAELLQAVYREVLPPDHKERYLLLQIAKHPNTSREVLQELAQLEEPARRIKTLSHQLSWTAMAHPHFPQKRLSEALQEAISQRFFDKAQDLLKSPHATPQLLSSAMRLAGQKDWYSRRLLAALVKDPRLSGDDLCAALASPQWRIRAALAAHPNTTPQALRALAEDAIPEVRVVAAKHPALPAEFLGALIASGATPDLYACSSRRVSLPEQQLHELLQRGPFARMLAAKACELQHQKRLEALLRDRHPRVREVAAQNPNLTAQQRATLLYSASCYTRAAAAQNPSNSGDDLGLELKPRRDGNALLRKVIAAQPNTSAARLLVLARTNALDVAQNPSAPVACLERLSKSQHLAVRRAVALHPRAPQEILLKLLQRPLPLPLETARLRVVLADPAHQERDARALLPVFQSNQGLFELDEGKRELSLQDVRSYLAQGASRERALVLLIFRKAPPSTRREQGPRELLFAGEELIATVRLLAQHPDEASPSLDVLLLHSQCHGQGLGREIVGVLERLLYSRGVRELRLAVFQERERVASFWARLGYQRYAESEHPSGRALWRLRRALL